jgi:glycosyltransferase involved in cell wall biosynthesis
MRQSVSVLLPAFNAEKYIGASIESILKQSYKNFELVLIDDGSSDSTLQILKSYSNLDNRIVVISQKNSGLSSALNAGLNISKSEICARIDADDIAEIDRLRQQLVFLNENPDISVVGSWIKIFGDGCISRVWKNPISPSEIYLTIFIRNPLFHPSVMFRKSRVLAAGGYDVSVPYDQDYDLWIRMSKAGDQFANIPKALTRYRIHKDQMGVIYMPNTRFDWMQRNIEATLSMVGEAWDKNTKAKLLETVVSEKYISSEFVRLDIDFFQDFITKIEPSLPTWFNKKFIDNFLEARLLNYITIATIFNGIKTIIKYKKFRLVYLRFMVYGIIKKIKYKVNKFFMEK